MELQLVKKCNCCCSEVGGHLKKKDMACEVCWRETMKAHRERERGGGLGVCLCL